MHKNTTLKLFLILFIIILIAFVIFVAYEKKSDSKSTKTTNELSDEEKKFTTTANEEMFTINSISDYISPIDNETKMKKILITFNNDTDNEINTGAYLFHLADVNKSELGLCYTRNLNLFYESDMLSLTSLPNSSITGYIYCIDNAQSFEFLKITYATKGYVDENGKFAVDTNDIFVKINN